MLPFREEDGLRMELRHQLVHGIHVESIISFPAKMIKMSGSPQMTVIIISALTARRLSDHRYSD